MPSGVFRYSSPACYHFAFSESHFEGMCVGRGGGTHTHSDPSWGFCLVGA